MSGPRDHGRRLISGMRVYRVTLVGGPWDGFQSISSNDIAYMGGEKYVRRADDRYYHEPKAGGKN